jgi:hypothetical protein
MAVKICFPPFQPLPGEPDPPTIDGFIEPEEFIDPGFGTTPAQVDTGWNNAMRITYVADAAVGAGRPLAVVQTLKDANFLYLAFIVRRDTAFHDNDCVAIVLRPNFPGVGAVKDGTERRIDIFPNSTGTGVAGTAPRDVNYYRWNVTNAMTGAGTWQDMGNNPVANVQIACSSWVAGPNANENKNWSVEVKLPIAAAGANGGGADWITLANTFGFYCNIIRLCGGGECQDDPTPFDGHSFQFTFPRADYATGDRLFAQQNGEVDLNEYAVPLDWLAEASLGNCAGVNGVKFQNGASSIGVLSGGNIVHQIQRNAANTFVARVVNTGGANANQVTASFRIANWGIGPGSNAKWNLIPATGGTTNPSAPQTVNMGGASTDLTMQWALSPAEQALYAHPPTAAQPLDSHQCIWVLLDSVQAVDFVESTARRNMDVTPLSEHEQSADISGDGYPPPPGGAADQEMMLIVSQMRRGRLVPKEPGQDFNSRTAERLKTGRAFNRGETYGGPDGPIALLFALLRQLFGGFSVVYDWVWITDAYRTTEYELKASGRQYKIHEPVGSFGYLAEHVGLVSGFEQSITAGPTDAARFAKTGRNAYRVRVPNGPGGKVQIVTKLVAREAKLPWWFWLLLVIVGIIIVVLVT